MNKTEVMKTLEAAGGEMTRRTYLRHGIPEPMFGVRYADIYKLVKRLGTNDKLADQLWRTGNHDARIVATMIADPGAATASTIDTWAKTVDNQLLVDAIAGYAAKSALAERCLAKWTKSKNEWLAATGWHLLSTLAIATDSPISNDELRAHVATIEQNIHDSPNRVRHSMNGALIACGSRIPRDAKAAARRIGKVDVDHGDTSCKTPDALQYIEKMALRASKKKATAAKKKQAQRKTTTKKKTAKSTTAKRTSAKRPSKKVAKKATKKATKKKPARKAVAKTTAKKKSTPKKTKKR
ncbi:MAG: DNA alkylation repair protein [Planctomycetota bacterium]